MNWTRLLLVAAITVAAGAPVAAQDWPSGPVRAAGIMAE
jgi:hypothetical protein